MIQSQRTPMRERRQMRHTTHGLRPELHDRFLSILIGASITLKGPSTRIRYCAKFQRQSTAWTNKTAIRHYRELRQCLMPQGSSLGYGYSHQYDDRIGRLRRMLSLSRKRTNRSSRVEHQQRNSRIGASALQPWTLFFFCNPPFKYIPS